MLQLDRQTDRQKVGGTVLRSHSLKLWLIFRGKSTDVFVHTGRCVEVVVVVLYYVRNYHKPGT